MDEILKKLLQSELLSEETKAEISEQWTVAVEAFKTQVREEVAADVRTQLAEQWITERDELVAKVDAFVTEALKAELAELDDDINSYRDLQAEHAEKLVEAKHQLAEEVAVELDKLVDKLDVFLDEQLSIEMEELREDIAIVKQNDFGRQLFEAFASTFAAAHVDEESVTTKLRVAEAQLRDAEAALATAETERSAMVREAKLEKLLSNLTGKKREQMEMVLKSIDTARLEESYKFFISRIMREEAEPTAKPLTEGAVDGKKTTVVTGNDPVEPAAAAALSESTKMLQRLAGIIK